ncbi:MAG: tripartite tricarboxylate transporter substrate binding protein [Bradyrhizobium sp.]|nr:tripartite tricarboxylate transporter substrate binding protein [Bradyrhizobium sp.]
MLAQELSRGSVSLMVPFPPGGASDVLARNFAPALAKVLQRTVVVENLTGASGSIGASRVLHGAADGSLILVGSPTETILAPLTIKGLNYKASDFKLLGIVYTAPLALYARRDLDVRSVDELVALSKRSPDQPFNYGSPGPGSLYHIATENLRKATGLDATHIPYRGGTPMLQDLMAGTIDLTMLPVDNVLGGLVDSGKIKVLGVTSAQRAPRYPATPTFDESASVKGFGHPVVWVGIFVAQGTPAALTTLLHKAVVDALASEDTRRALESTGGTVPETLSLPAAQSFYAEQTRSLTAMAKLAKVQAD